MNIEIKDKVKLNDKKTYFVGSKAVYRNKTYYMLMDVDDFENIKFCFEGEKENSLIESNDVKLNRELLPLLAMAANAVKD